jgi:hypothetical protein
MAIIRKQKSKRERCCYCVYMNTTHMHILTSHTKPSYKYPSIDHITPASPITTTITPIPQPHPIYRCNRLQGTCTFVPVWALLSRAACKPRRNAGTLLSHRTNSAAVLLIDDSRIEPQSYQSSKQMTKSACNGSLYVRALAPHYIAVIARGELSCAVSAK